MQLLPIALAAYKNNWQRFAARMRNKRFLALQTRIFKRDDYTCRYCGFWSEKYQVVVNHDHNYNNNKTSNLVTACVFCAQCFFLDCVGKNDKMGGYIIYLPEISQADLNHFCRALFTSIQREAPYKGRLQTAYLSLKDRVKEVEEIFGPESSIPHIFGQSLIDSDLTKEQLENKVLKQLRLLPEKKFFKSKIDHWKETIFKKVPL